MSARSELICFRVTAEFKQSIEKEALKHGLSLSKYVCAVLVFGKGKEFEDFIRLSKAFKGV